MGKGQMLVVKRSCCLRMILWGDLQYMIMKKVVNRFWDWLFHPSIVKLNLPNAKAIFYRYPSPGNAPLETMGPVKTQDYKTPYTHTQYNVRYTKSVPMQTREQVQTMTLAPLCSTTILRLKKCGLLKKGEENNVDAVSAAKAKFQQKYGYSADETVFKNDADNNVLKSTNREEMSAYIQSFYQEARHLKASTIDYSSIRKTIDDPEVVPLQSVDMFVTPHFQQGRISNEYLMQEAIDDVVKKQKVDVYVGDARFWKAIDESFPTNQVQKVQTHVEDSDPLGFELRPSKVEYELDKSGKIVDIHPKH